MHAVIPVSIATCRTSGRSIQWGATWSLADELVYRQGLATKARKLANKGFDAARREALLAGADVNDETVAHFRNAEVDVIRLGW